MNARRLTVCGVIGALYAVMTLVLAPISYGAVQVRVSECLCLLPFVAPYTSWGLFAGCLVANLLSPFGINLLDVVFGSLTTLCAGLLTGRCKNRYLAALPPVVLNALVVGAILAATGAEGAAFGPAFAVNALQVGAGEAVAVYIFGLLALRLYERPPIRTWLMQKGETQ